MRKNNKNKNTDDLDLNSLTKISLKNISRDRQEKEIKKDFKLIDSDNSGYIDLNELRKGLKKYGLVLSIKSTEKILKKYDDNPDNKIDIQEFVLLKRDIDTNDLRRTNDIKKTKRHRKNKKPKATRRHKNRK